MLHLRPRRTSPRSPRRPPTRRRTHVSSPPRSTRTPPRQPGSHCSRRRSPSASRRSTTRQQTLTACAQSCAELIGQITDDRQRARGARHRTRPGGNARRPSTAPSSPLATAAAQSSRRRSSPPPTREQRWPRDTGSISPPSLPTPAGRRAVPGLRPPAAGPVHGAGAARRPPGADRQAR